MDVQRQIRENTRELNEFLKDLKGWEHTVKEKEKNILSRGASKDNKNTESGTPCCQLPSRSEFDRNEVQEIRSSKADVEDVAAKVTRSRGEAKKQGDTLSKSRKMAASHTYEHFRNKWDTFDVDAALKELDETSEGEDDRLVKKVSKREILPPGGCTQSKKGPREVTSVAHSLPSGKSVCEGVNTMAAADRLASSYGFDDAPPDAASEKDLGNEYFKEGRYVRAIDCYSRSIALQPTAVAYANRAMAAIRIRRFEDAELDCSEAISLDDRYTKAYARRGTARKELKNYLAAVEDFEFALRLEPENKELKKQYTEVDELHQKESGGELPQQNHPLIVSKAKEVSIPPQQQNNPVSVDKVKEVNIPPPQQRTSGKSTAAFVDGAPSSSLPHDVSADSSAKGSCEELPSSADSFGARSELVERPTDGKLLSNKRNSIPVTFPSAGVAQKQARFRDRKIGEVVATTQAAAAHASATAMTPVSCNVVAPRSSFEFEVMWKGFGGDKSLQVRVLKVMDPPSLPKVFKDSLGAPLLLEIIQSLELLFPEDAEQAVQILENLTKVGRFNMTVMFLTSKDKIGLGQLWEQFFMNSPYDLQKRLQALRATYLLV